MIRVATSVPRQFWTKVEKLDWLAKALLEHPCDLFCLPQEFWGGGSTRYICEQRGIHTDDAPVTESWLKENLGPLCQMHGVHLGVGASVERNGDVTEDYLYFDSDGELVGYHSKIALPVQDSIVLGGASGITPQTDYAAAVRVIELPKLGIRVGTVFCWQVFFVDFWNDLMQQGCSLVVHPIKFAPRAWYKKSQNAVGAHVRTGFTQNPGSDNPDDDALGWIRKLKFESEFKQLPIAVTCNTWDGGEKFLALEGWVEELTGKTNLHHLPSTADTDVVTVTEYEPSLYEALSNLNDGDYGKFKGIWAHLASKTMARKAIRIERKTKDGKAVSKLDAYQRKLEVAATRSNATLDALFEAQE